MKFCDNVINVLKQAVILVVIKLDSDIKHILNPFLLDISKMQLELPQLCPTSADKDLKHGVVKSLGGTEDRLVYSVLELRGDANANVHAKASRDSAVREMKLEVGELILLACNVALNFVELGQGLRELVLHPGGGVSVRFWRRGGDCGDGGCGGVYWGRECWKGKMRLEGREC